MQKISEILNIFFYDAVKNFSISQHKDLTIEKPFLKAVAKIEKSFCHQVNHTSFLKKIGNASVHCASGLDFAK